MRHTETNFIEEEPEALLGTKWGEALAFNTHLIHLDLSFNRIDFHDTSAIANSLPENTTLFGLHYTGNMGRMDSLGYLHPVENSFFINPKAWHFAKKINGLKTLFKDPKRQQPSKFNNPKRSLSKFMQNISSKNLKSKTLTNKDFLKQAMSSQVSQESFSGVP